MTRDGKFWIKKKRNCTIRVAKTKTLISFVVTAKLICVFVFAYADCWFSHEAAHLMKKGSNARYTIIIMEFELIFDEIENTMSYNIIHKKKKRY